MPFTAADRAYIRANYLTLSELCYGRAEMPETVQTLINAGILPKASYVLDDGTPMFPPDYFDLADSAGGPRRVRTHFAQRYRLAAAAEGILAHDVDSEWEAYLTGGYGVCLNEVSPENIVRKAVLVASICQLLVLARPRAADWGVALRAQVDELDALEREFSPDFDRSDLQDHPPTRDLLIAAARERFPDVFADA